MSALNSDDQARLDALRSAYPGCWHAATEEGLVVVRRPSAAEMIAVEDAVASLVDLGAKLSPYAGLDAVKALVVHPEAARTEALLQEYPRFFDQIVTMMRFAAQGGAQGVSVDKVEIRDEELYMRETPAGEDGRHQKRHGGRVFAVECYRLERDEDNPLKPRKVVVGRHLMRRLGLMEDRELKREVTATGYTDERGNRLPRNATLAKVARAHVVENVPGCSTPDWEAHPHLLVLLGQAVIDQSGLQLGGSAGK